MNLDVKMIFLVLFCLLTSGTVNWAGDSVPDYHDLDRRQVADCFKWRMKDLYGSINEWKAHKVEVLKRFRQLKALKKNWKATAGKGLPFLQYLSSTERSVLRLYAYAELQNHVNMEDAGFQRLYAEASTLLGQFYGDLADIKAEVLIVGKTEWLKLFKLHPELEPWKNRILDIFARDAHSLSPDLKALSTDLAPLFRLPEKAMRALLDVDLPTPEVTLSDGKRVKLSYTGFRRYYNCRNDQDRIRIHRRYYQNMARFQTLIATLFHGGISSHVIDASQHNFASSLEMRMFDENKKASDFKTAIRIVKTHLPLFHRYLKLKGKLLGLEKMSIVDLNVMPFELDSKQYSFSEAKKLACDAVTSLGFDYHAQFKRIFNSGWLDIYPHQNKRNFGYAYDVPGVHPFVLLNYSGTFHDIYVMVHELGHAMHAWFSNRYSHFEHRMSAGMLTEAFAHLNEHFLMDLMISKSGDLKQKINFVDKAILGICNAIFNMTRLAEFEHDLHQRVTRGDVLTASLLNGKFMTLAKKYYGSDIGVCEIPDYYSIAWADVPHLFMNHYLISYTDGMIISLAMMDMIKKSGDSGREKVLSVLKSGTRKSANCLLKGIGIDLSNPDTFRMAFGRLKRLIDVLEKDYKKLIKGELK